MKATKKVLLVLVTIFFTLTLSAQYAGATLEYIKVKPGQWNAYLELEKSIKDFHQVRVEEGIITRWALYQKLYTSENDPYEFILVTLNDDFKKTQNPYPQELIDANFSEEEQSEFMKKVWETRSVVQSEYYDRVTFAEGGQPYKYLRFIRYSVPQGGSGYFEKLRKELVKPLFDEVVKRGHNAGWSVWGKDPSDKKFQYVAVNTFAEYGDWKKDYNMEEIFNEVFPDKDLGEAREAVLGSRTRISEEYWELLLSTDEISE